MGRLWSWFLSLSLLGKIAVVLAFVVLLLILGPLWVIIAIIALPVIGIVLIVKALRGRPLRTWGIVCTGCFALLVASCTASGIVYGGDTEQVAERSPAEESEDEAAAEETRYVTVEETVERTIAAVPAEDDDSEDSDDDRRRAAPVVTGSDGSSNESNEVARDEPEAAPVEEALVEEESDDSGLSVAVASVTDGDTIEIAEPVEGLTDVRLIGMDTPETYGGTEPYGPEASAFAATLLEGQTVELELDEEVVDPYGRLLAYVYLPDGTMANEMLVAQGYAQVATFPPNTRYEGDFIAAQESARAAGLGIWSLPEDQLCQLADRGNGIGGGCEELPVVQPEPAPVPGIDEEPIIEELPMIEEAPSSGATDGWYEGAPDLDCSDFSAPVTVSPGDPFRLDADGDGTGCDS